jgi:DNA repair exonuclease SbcCD nuclease subunit
MDGPVARVALEGLVPGTDYEYRIVGEDVWRRFTTPATDPDEGFAFAVAGDLQPFNEETDRTTLMVMEKLRSLSPTFVLQLGDVAEVGTLKKSVRRAVAVLSTVGADTPILPTAGNHDYYYGVPSAKLFKSIFPVPYVSDSPRRNTWYSQSVGPLHIAVLDTEARRDRFDAQLSWLETDLREADDAGASWVMLAMHRPLLSTTTSSEDQRWARALLPLIARYDVDAVFWGHNHLFEHYRYRYGGNGLVFEATDQPAEESTHFFTVGTAGARVDALYPRFFAHRPYREVWKFEECDTGRPVILKFYQGPWNKENVKRKDPGVRYQRPAVYPLAASYYSYPFDSAEDAAAGHYSSHPSRRYSDDAEFFGYTYGETSIHYLWVEVSRERCVITAHYADGPAGEQGTVITTPHGAAQRFVLE